MVTKQDLSLIMDLHISNLLHLFYQNQIILTLKSPNLLPLPPYIKSCKVVNNNNSSFLPSTPSELPHPSKSEGSTILPAFQYLFLYASIPPCIPTQPQNDIFQYQDPSLHKIHFPPQRLPSYFQV